MTNLHPISPLPDPLRGLEYGTFTHTSIVDRLPDIARRTLKENEFPTAVAQRLQQLIAGIPDAHIMPIRDEHAPDHAAWEAYNTPHLGQNWLEAPWFFIENYFYRRIMAIIGYFRPTHEGFQKDPFLYQKRQGVAASRQAIHTLSDNLAQWLQDGDRYAALTRLLALDLWGNQADLSLWPADASERPDHDDEERQKEFLLVDGSEEAAAYLLGLGDTAVSVHFLNDNAGFELVADLALADWLLTSRTATAVHFHLKAHPTFVSDALIDDVTDTIDFFTAEANAATQQLGERLQAHRENGRFHLHSHFFWTSPLPTWEMPDSLRRTLDAADLVISKGDAQYRRLLGDRHWPFTTPFADAVAYFPAPLLALRTLKSEIVVGVSEEKQAYAAARDDAWLYDGQWGVMQFRQSAR